MILLGLGLGPKLNNKLGLRAGKGELDEFTPPLKMAKIALQRNG